jgi:peptidyl-prolyl cis-trans isomerase C
MISTNTLMRERYLIKDIVSEEGARAVYSADDQQSGRSVILRRFDLTDEDERRAFEGRLRAISANPHSAMPRVIEQFTEGESQFLVTEQIEGDSLADAAEGRDEPYAEEEVKRWGGALLEALSHLHSQEPPIIHGQVEPKNITLTPGGEVLLANPVEERRAGAFASPEEARGDTDARSDIYSLGATLYYLATATTPPDAARRVEATADEQLDPLRRANKVNSQVSTELADTLSKAMALDPAERFASAAEMRSALTGEPALEAAEGQKYETTPLAAGQRQGQRSWAIGAVVVLLVAAIGIGFFAWQRNESRDATSLRRVKLNARDMQLLFQEMIPPQAQAQIAGSPEQKKRLVSDVKEFLAVAQQAESEGYAEKPEVQSQLSINTDNILSSTYREKNPQAKATDDEINAYHQANPTAFDDFVKSDPRLQMQMQMQGEQGEQAKTEFKKQFGEMKVLADRARTEKMDQDDLTRLRLIVARGRVLGQAYLRDFQTKLDGEIKPEDVQRYYQEHQSELDEVHARHILISTEDGAVEEKQQKAQEILTRIRGGEDFTKLAAEFSDDQASKVQGGDLGFVSKGSLVPEFEKAMYALKPGEVSDLVKTEFGFHIIKVEERKPTASPETDEKARQQITEWMKQERMQNRVKEIVASSDIEVADNFDTTPKPMPQQPAMPPAGAMPPGHPNQ